VDFSLARARRRRVASIVRIGRWKEDNLRTEFAELVRWAAHHHLRTGRWIFVDRGRHRWEACLEIGGHPASDGRIRLRTLPSEWVATVTFDPERISPRLVYHGLIDWTRARRKDGTIRSVGAVREVYLGSPWTNRRAWAQCRVEFVVRR